MYEIGPFRLDPDAKVLTHQGEPVALGARAVDVLTALVEHANEHVAKSRIIDAAWPGRVVEESNLSVQIAAIRRALSMAPGGDRWVETLARRGYRFVGPVCELRHSGAAASNVPLALTSFVGREREIADLQRLLKTSRLVTLAGTGGIGKTRLAMRVATAIGESFPDGAWFVDLAPVASDPLLPAAVAQVLQVREVPGKALEQSICDQLRGRRLLLVLDNCEHLVEACARLAESLLRCAPGLTLLATSREALRIAGEQTYPLSPLSLPGASSAVDAVAASEAVRLFVDRARQQLPDFSLDDGRAPLVAQLCIDLDGIPLALELAAGRVRSLSLEQILDRLDDRFRLLTSGARTALPRQQTLKAALDWSYDLLDEEKRAVLRRCACFAGGFSIEAAAGVACDDALPPLRVAEVVTQLVARSLVVADTGEARARFRMLETTRAYAMEKLAESGEEAGVRRRHARFFRGFFEHAPSDWLRMSDARWRAIYFPELANLRGALDWSLGPDGDAEISVSLAGHSFPVWTMLAMLQEGRARLEAAALLIDERIGEAEQARLWLSIGVLRDAAPEEALVALDRAVELYARLGDAEGSCDALRRRARAFALTGRLAESRRALDEIHPQVMRLGIPKAIAFYHSDAAFLEQQLGNARVARDGYERALALFREAGAEYAALASLGALADATWALGDLEAATEAFRQALAILRASPMSRKSSLAFALANLAGVLTERGELDEALGFAREAVPMLRDTGFAWIFLDHLALRVALAGRLDDGARLAGHADATFAAKKATRQPNEARARERLHQLLGEKLAPAALARLTQEGASLSEAEADRISLA